MVLKNKRTLTKISNYTGSAKKESIDIDKNFLIQRILLTITGTVSFNGNSALVEDALLNLFKQISIRAVGEGSTKTILELSGVDVFHKNYFDYSMPKELIVPKSGANQKIRTSLTLDFRADKKDSEDFSLAIPAHLLNNLQMVFDYADKTIGYGTNISKIDLTTKITLIEGIPEDDEDFSDQPIINQIAKEMQLDSTTGNQSLDNVIDVGAVVTRCIIVTKDNRGKRSDDEIEHYTLKNGTVPIIEEYDFYASKSEDVEEYGLSSVVDGDITIKGYTILDFAPFPFDEDDAFEGLDTTEMNVGDLSLVIKKKNPSGKLRVIQESIEE